MGKYSYIFMVIFSLALAVSSYGGQCTDNDLVAATCPQTAYLVSSGDLAVPASTAEVSVTSTSTNLLTCMLLKHKLHKVVVTLPSVRFNDLNGIVHVAERGHNHALCDMRALRHVILLEKILI